MMFGRSSANSLEVAPMQTSMQTLDTGALEKMSAWTEVDSSFLTELIAAYLDDASEQVAQLHRAAQVRELQSLANAAHALRPASISMGALRIGILCQSIEETVREIQPSATGGVGADEADAVWQHLEQQVIAIAQELQMLQPMFQDYLGQRRMHI